MRNNPNLPIPISLLSFLFLCLFFFICKMLFSSLLERSSIITIFRYLLNVNNDLRDSGIVFWFVISLHWFQLTKNGYLRMFLSMAFVSFILLILFYFIFDSINSKCTNKRIGWWWKNDIMVHVWEKIKSLMRIKYSLLPCHMVIVMNIYIYIYIYICRVMNFLLGFVSHCN